MPKKVVQSIDIVLNLYKRVSETPLQTIERFVLSHPEYRDSKMTYAGRLDPMAEGVLVVLSGEKNKERDTYTGLDKEYEFEFILGAQTDTHDMLGKVTAGKVKQIEDKEIEKALKKYVGTFAQKYPAYSSKVVDGVPLFDIARKGKISTVVMPEHNVIVNSIELLDKRKVPLAQFKHDLESKIKAVKGDFRQDEILQLWKTYFESGAQESVTIYKVKVFCGSGFYVRQLVSDIGNDLGTGAVTVSILRTRVGEYLLKDSVK